jgi:hypothetical protein
VPPDGASMAGLSSCATATIFSIYIYGKPIDIVYFIIG